MLLLAACDAPDPAPPVVAADPVEQDILSTTIALDLTTLAGTATIDVIPGPGGVRLDVHGLDVHAVRVDGADVALSVADGTLTVPATAQAELAVDYTFPTRTVGQFDGWMPTLGVTFIWPDHCGNLYPCDPAMADGAVFGFEVTGVPEGQTAIYPTTTYSDAPAYMPGIAVGNYTKVDLGATPAGTTVSAWYLTDVAGGYEDTVAGTAHLVDAFDFYETTYGPYAFGPDVGTVQVDWGSDSWGGMEHHPYFHVGMYDFWNGEAQVHEAAHGWFGDGVRVACWEDFVLSEGTVTYMAARAMEESAGPDLWAYYVEDFLEPICDGRDVNTIVLPETCNAIDFEESDVWSLATYMKGACFYEEVGERIGYEVLDAVIGSFYVANVNDAARMRAMIDAIEAAADPADVDAIEAYATDWLYTEACPEDYAARCGAHAR